MPGLNGQDGRDGQSAYELWKQYISDGTKPNPHDPTIPWPGNKNSVNDFWEYLRGNDGATIKYNDGDPTAPIIAGKYNVLPILWNGANKEFIDPANGEATFKVFGKDGNPVGAGVKVKGLPGAPDPTKEYITLADGTFKVQRTDLPNKVLSQNRIGKATVTDGAVVEETAPNTETPNRVNTRLVLEAAYPRQISQNVTTNWIDIRRHVTAVKYRYEREIDGVWLNYPDNYPAYVVKSAGVTNATANPVTVADLDQSTTWHNLWHMDTKSDFLAGTRGKFVLVVRPTVLTADEEVGTPETITIGGMGSTLNTAYNALKAIKWNGQPNYFTIYGITNFYGESPVMNAIVHNPEIYPSFDVKNLKLAIVTGASRVYGEIDESTLSCYYYKHELQASTNKWVATKMQGNTLFHNFNSSPDGNNRVQAYVNITVNDGVVAATGAQFAERRTLYADWKKFALNPWYKDNYMSTCLRISDNHGAVIYGASDEAKYKGYYFEVYRSTPRYRLHFDGTTYKVYRPFNPTATPVVVPQTTFPTGWDN